MICRPSTHAFLIRSMAALEVPGPMRKEHISSVPFMLTLKDLTGESVLVTTRRTLQEATIPHHHVRAVVAGQI